MSRSKTVAFVPLCSSFSYNYPGNMHINYLGTYHHHLLQKGPLWMTSSMAFSALVDLLELRFWSCLKSKNKATDFPRKEQANTQGFQYLVWTQYFW